jgi:hypothetical protein
VLVPECSTLRIQQEAEFPVGQLHHQPDGFVLDIIRKSGKGDIILGRDLDADIRLHIVFSSRTACTITKPPLEAVKATPALPLPEVIEFRTLRLPFPPPGSCTTLQEMALPETGSLPSRSCTLTAVEL